MPKFSATPGSRFQPACFYHPRSATERATVAVSACLTGEKARYDGTDKLLAAHPLLQSELKLIPVCPEIGAGLGVPRPPVQLTVVGDEIHALGRDDHLLDVTSALQNYAEQSLQQLTQDFSLCGYLWKSRSPSCGLGSTPLFNSAKHEVGRTSGIQAAHFHRYLAHIYHREETYVTTERAALAFILGCRLVFDFLYADNSPLPALHHHYRFLIEHFNDATIASLHTLQHGAAKTDYLAALLDGCSQLSDENLLKLFQ